MIIFNGYISGNAERYQRKKTLSIGRNIFLVIWLGIIFPPVTIVAISMNAWWLILIHLVSTAIFVGLIYIPKSGKVKKALIPKKIFTDEEYIVSVSEQGEVFLLISDAKLVRDFGEFYEIVFPFGKISTDFICQKDLLTQGTLEEFEALFEGKIVKKELR